MSWITPKTDWEIKPPDENGRYNGDWFNISDYNRITGNIEYLYQLSQQLYLPFSIETMPDQSYDDDLYAETINSIENNIQALIEHTWQYPNAPQSKQWSSNGHTPTVDDLNRIEGVCLTLYNAFVQQADAKPKLSFQLNGGEF